MAPDFLDRHVAALLAMTGRVLGLASLTLRQDECVEHRAPRRAAPSKHRPPGGQRSTRSDKRGGHI